MKSSPPTNPPFHNQINKMKPLVRSAALRKEADQVLFEIDLLPILSRYGRVVPTGSYYLDVMVYPDIDLYISEISIGDLFDIARQLAENEPIRAIVFEKSDDARLPGGLYLKARVAHGNWGRPWKIDIWSLAEGVIDEKMRDMVHFKENMTPELREQIIRYKASILTDQGRTPMYSGYFIYKAVIDDDITDPIQITKSLIKNGVQMERAHD